MILCHVSVVLSIKTCMCIFFVLQKQFFAVVSFLLVAVFFRYWEILRIKMPHIALFFSIWLFFHEHLRFSEQEGKWETIYLTPVYHFRSFHRQLDISCTITADSSPLYIANSRSQNGSLCFPRTSWNDCKFIFSPFC